MKYIYNVILIPVYITGYILEFGWKFPKLFWKVTINTFKYKTKYQG